TNITLQRAIQLRTGVIQAKLAAVHVGAALRNGADDPARRGAVLRVVTRSLDRDLIDEVDDDPLARNTGLEVGRVHAVHDVAVLGRRGAVDHDAAGAADVV